MTAFHVNMCDVASKLRTLWPGEEDADVGCQVSQLLSALDPCSNGRLPGVLSRDPGLEGPAQFDVTAGVEDGSELQVTTGPGTFAVPSPKVGSQAVHEVGQVLGIPDGHDDVTQVSVQAVSVEIDGEGGLVLIDELAIVKPYLDCRVLHASNGHLRWCRHVEIFATHGTKDRRRLTLISG